MRRRRRRKRTTSETDIVGNIIATLQSIGVWCWRTNSGAVRVRGGYHVQLAPPGTPDILGAIRGTGRMFGIEVKTLTGEERATQIAWREQAEKWGVLVGMARSEREALELYMGWREAA